MVYSLVGDIVDSKKIIDRERAQKDLEMILDEINLDYNDDMEKKLSVTLGDEFQGIFNRFDNILLIIHKIMFRMKSIRIRFGVGIGELKFDFGTKENPYRSDGSAWWFSREATNQIRNLNSKNNIIEYSNIRIISGTDATDKLINVMLDLCFAIRDRWTDKQKEIIENTIIEYGFSEEYKYSNIAKKYRQSVSTIHDKFKTSGYIYYINAMRMINSFIVDGGLKDGISNFDIRTSDG